MRRALAVACVVAASLAPIPATWAQAAPPATAPAARAPDVPYEPTPHETVAKMLDLANVGPRDVVYDLGSGDGRIVIAAARRGARATGIDIDPQRIAEANENARRAGLAGKVTFVQGDLFEADFRDATVVTLFLWPGVNLKLRPRLLELQPGTRIVSYMHDMGDWAPERTVPVRANGRNRNLYLWIVPKR